LFIKLDDAQNSLESLQSADIAVGTASMLLIEGLLLGKRVVSYQPGAKSPDDFILTQHGVLPFLNSFEAFKRALVPFPCAGIVQKISEFIRGIACPS
jgi:hypothetical protein